MLYKIRSNPMHLFYGALPVPYLPVWVTRGALVAHQYTYAPPRCRTSQYRRTIIHLSISLWNYLAPVFDGVGLAGFKSMVNAFLLDWAALSPFVLYCFSVVLLSVYRLVYCGALVLELIGCRSLSPSVALPTSFNNYYNNENDDNENVTDTSLLQWHDRLGTHTA